MFAPATMLWILHESGQLAVGSGRCRPVAHETVQQGITGFTAPAEQFADFFVHFGDSLKAVYFFALLALAAAPGNSQGIRRSQQWLPVMQRIIEDFSVFSGFKQSNNHHNIYRPN